MNMQPLYDRVFLQRIEEEKKTKGGIVIPDTLNKKSIEGKIISVGKGKTLKNGEVIPLEVKKGDRVLFRKNSGAEVTLGGEDYLVMREEDIFGIIN